MNFEQNAAKESGDFKNRSSDDLPDLTLDPMLRDTIRDFRTSVHAWSESACNRPRPVRMTPKHMALRRATAWALGCVLAVGAAAGGIYERQHQQDLAQATRATEIQRQLAEQHAREVEDLLAKVDRDISRQVPNAMEPLARLMAEDESQ